MISPNLPHLSLYNEREQYDHMPCQSAKSLANMYFKSGNEIL